jgi:cytochrome c553
MLIHVRPLMQTAMQTATPTSSFSRTLSRTGQVWLASLCLSAGLVSPAMAGDTTPAGELARWNQAAGAPGQAARGEAFFNATHGGEWSCASCHGKPPTGAGKHASTGKVIQPLAPARNAERFTDVAKADKWFKRNCKDVLSRECTAAEKADVMAWLVSLK